MIKTNICELLGIEYPIFQGGMAWVADANLAAAVSNAGGLGIIAGMNSNGEQLTTEIEKCKKLTDKPFGVNVMLMSPFVEEVADVVIKEDIKIITTGAGNPAKYMEKWLAAGIKVIPVVPSANLARLAQRCGATAVIAEGGESGGHIGELSTMPLVPIICDAVTIPVIAAGGIVDGRGLAASFMLGAQGVQVGTRFLVAKECTIHQNYKDRVLKAKDTDSITTGKRLGHPVRSLKTPYSRKYFKMEYDSNISNEELEAFGAGSLRKAVKDGDIQDGCFIAGQVAALVTKEQTCKEIIEDIFTQGEKILKGEINKTYTID